MSVAPAISRLWDAVAVLLLELQTAIPIGELKGAATSTLSAAQVTERIVYLQKKLVQADAEIGTINSELAVLRPKLTTTTATKPMPKDSSAFVEHLYTCILGRASEKKGYDGWFAKTASSSLFKMYNDFFSSREYIEKKVSDEQFVKQMYACVLFREADPAGKSAWVQRLVDGKSRTSVLQDLMNSKEFKGSTGTTLSRNTSLGF